jgi:hypothetical protein
MREKGKGFPRKARGKTVTDVSSFAQIAKNPHGRKPLFVLVRTLKSHLFSGAWR